MKRAIVLLLLAISTFCFAIDGSGNLIKETREIDDFSGVSLSISADVTIVQSDEYFCEVTAEDNLIEFLITEVEDGTLKIGFKKHSNIRKHQGIHIRVSMPDVEHLRISGSGDIDSEGLLKGDKLAVSVHGSGDANLSVEYDVIETNIHGSGDVFLKGTTGSLNVSVHGSGDVLAFDLNTSAASITINGSGDAKIAVDKALSVVINGSGDVHYKGSPSSISKTVHGSGDIVQVGSEKLN